MTNDPLVPPPIAGDPVSPPDATVPDEPSGNVDAQGVTVDSSDPTNQVINQVDPMVTPGELTTEQVSRLTEEQDEPEPIVEAPVVADDGEDNWEHLTHKSQNGGQHKVKIRYSEDAGIWELRPVSFVGPIDTDTDKEKLLSRVPRLQ